MTFNTSVSPFLLTSCLSPHLSISAAKSLSSDHAQKTSTATIKHLAEERPVFVFTNVTNFLLANLISSLDLAPHDLMGWNKSSRAVSNIYCPMIYSVQQESCSSKTQHIKTVIELNK